MPRNNGRAERKMPGPEATSLACPAARSSLGSWAQCPHLSNPPPALPWPWWTPDAPPKGAPCPVPSPGLRPGTPGPRSDYSPPNPFPAHTTPHIVAFGKLSGPWKLPPGLTHSPALGPGVQGVAEPWENAAAHSGALWRVWQGGNGLGAGAELLAGTFRARGEGLGHLSMHQCFPGPAPSKARSLGWARWGRSGGIYSQVLFPP